MCWHKAQAALWMHPHCLRSCPQMTQQSLARSGFRGWSLLQSQLPAGRALSKGGEAQPAVLAHQGEWADTSYWAELRGTGQVNSLQVSARRHEGPAFPRGSQTYCFAQVSCHAIFSKGKEMTCPVGHCRRARPRQMPGEPVQHLVKCHTLTVWCRASSTKPPCDRLL